jgi:hypothetical protein
MTVDNGSMVMTTPLHLKPLEGRHVSLALTDGSRIDDCQLVSAGRGRAQRVWIFANGADEFVPVSDIADIWECPAA